MRDIFLSGIPLIFLSGIPLRWIPGIKWEIYATYANERYMLHMVLLSFCLLHMVLNERCICSIYLVIKERKYIQLNSMTEYIYIYVHIYTHTHLYTAQICMVYTWYGVATIVGSLNDRFLLQKRLIKETIFCKRDV